eukprot:TRINITY_DN16479_c0_g1_i10.p1 TRINITY_DN16479_c0_g1~~TRINITY_DN16479_c0_g1_i10.p1  ORF type:complete len:384 (-),score=124.53 TRINITY_DN16479_c0_g1_i10:60-1211(-)
MSQFLVRVSKYKNSKEMRRKNLELELRKREEQECSFRPKTNALNSPQKICSRFRDPNWKRADLELLQLEKEEREKTELAKCTFRPLVYSKDAKPRYMKSTNCSFYIGSKEEDQTFTFHPRVDSSCGKSERIQSYLSIDPYKRLFETNRMRESQEQGSQAKKQDALKVIQQFYLRQCEHEQKRQQEHQQLRNALNICFKPAINEKSKEIVKRLDSAERRSKSPKRSLEHESGFTFRPEILAASRRLSPRSYEEMSSCPGMQKEQKVKRLRKELLQKEADKFTFQPKLCSPPFPAQSKLQLLDNLEGYLDRVSKNQSGELKEKKRKTYKELREVEEVEECTHAPKINSYPNFLHSAASRPKPKKANKYSRPVSYTHLTLPTICSV